MTTDSRSPDRYDELLRRMRIVSALRAAVFLAGCLMALAFGFELAPTFGPLF